MATVRKRKWIHAGKENEAWIVEYTDGGGKRRIKTFKTKKEADKARWKIESEIDGGVHVADRATITVAELANRFVGDCERRRRAGDKITGSTIANYRQLTGNHIVKWFGAKKLCDLTSIHIQAKFDSLTDDYAPRSLSSMRNVFVIMLDFAVRKGLLKRNILKDVPVLLPRPSAERVRIPNKTELKNLLNAALEKGEGEFFNAWANRLLVVCLGAFAGMRIGEICGLQWENVDFDAGTIHVRHSYSVYDKLKAPKSAAGVRDIPMSEPVRQALMNVLRMRQIVDEVQGQTAAGASRRSAKDRIRRRMLDEAVKVDLHALPNGFVVLGRDMKSPMKPSGTTLFWWPLMKKAGLMNGDEPLFTIHALRHAAASLFIEAGLPPLNLKQVIGHASVSITFNVYGHLFPEDTKTRDAVRSIEGAYTSLTSPTKIRQQLITV